jgi:V8-like Glu-specific endopeptidase
LFLSLAVPLHICSASVVASADKSVILTAAHCVRGGRGAGYAFAPGYHDGKAPFGFWRVTAAYGAPAWIKHTNDHDDFAFLTVAPRRIKGKLTDLQSVTGANRLGVAPKRGTAVTVTGYPLGVGGSPIHCRTKVFYDGAFPGFHCDGFADGTSGGPWVAGGGHRRTVVGLIAGLHQGGCVASTSYSSVLGAAAQAALRRAAHHKPGDDFPSPPGDGC